ncbi:MAG: TIGR02556 family CRISPR-associated protein [Candidatus Thorarchaeota archaeon]
MIVAMRELADIIASGKAPDVVGRLMTLNQVISKVIVIRLSRENNQWTYRGTKIVDFDRGTASRYLYRQPPPNGPGTTPAALITDVKKTFPKKTLAWFERVPKCCRDAGLDNEVSYVGDIGRLLASLKDQVMSDIEQSRKAIGSRQGNTLLTIELDAGGSTHLIGESEPFRKIFLELVKQDYYSKYGTTARGHGTCYVCKSEGEVYGFVTDILPFYTLDKKGFAPELDVSRGWKLFPVCVQCAAALETSKQFLDEKLQFDFYGAKYYIIPQSVRGEPDAIGGVLEVLSAPRGATGSSAGQGQKISMAHSGRRITSDENEILDYLSTLDDSVSLNFLFYIMEQSSMRVLSYAEDIPPSRLAKLFSIKELVDNRGLFYQAGMSFDFSFLRDILALGREAKDYKEFIHVTSRLLKDQTVERALILRRALDYLEDSRRKNGFQQLMLSERVRPDVRKRNDVLRALMLLEFIETHRKGSGDKRKLNDSTQLNRTEIANDIFETHPSFFGKHYQRAAFLIGLLAGRLIAIQQHDRGSAPFEKRLHSLSLDMKRLKRLYVKIEEKLKAYGYSDVYRDIQAMLTDELMKAADERPDNDELSLSFVVGLNQSYKFKSRKGDESVD